jgi:hypothetical protein
MEINLYKKKHYVLDHRRISLIVLFMILSTVSLLSQVSSVAFNNPFDFGGIVVVSPGSGSLILTGGNRTSSGNVIHVPQTTTSLATFSYNYRGGNSSLQWSEVSINVPSFSGMSVSDIIMTSNPALPINQLKNNTTINFTVTSAKLNTTTVLSPGKYTTNYTVTIKGTTFY